MQSFKIRPYQKGDEVEINDAFNEVFEQNRSIEEWYWKYQPENGGSGIMLAVDEGGKVLAHFAGVKVLMQVDGQVGTYFHSLDSYSLKTREVLKKRIFLKTFDEYIRKYAGPWPEKFPWHYGSGGGRHLQLGLLKEGMSTPVPITYLFKNINPYHRALGKYARRLVQKWLINRIPFELKEIDELWNRSSYRYKVSIIKDGTYIKRRYIAHPTRKYIYITAKGNSRIAALAVLKYDAGKLQWVDLIWDGQDFETLKALEWRVWVLAILLGALMVEMWLNNDEDAKDILLSRGMETIKNPYDLFIVSGTYVPDIDGEDLTRRLYFTMGDSDIF